MDIPPASKRITVNISGVLIESPSSEDFIFTNLFNLHSQSMREVLFYLSFTDEETEAKEYEMSYPGSHRKKLAAVKQGGRFSKV